jgi:predicted nucleotidyltransferase
MLMSASRAEIARAFAKEQIEGNPNIAAVIVTGSTARNDGIEASDIDIRLLMDDIGGKETKHEGGLSRRGDIFLDVEYASAAKFRDAADILKDPFLAGSVRDAMILFDRTGEFTEVQKVVVEQFMEDRWLRLRLSSLVPSIQRNCKEFIIAVREHNAAEMCRASIFALWTICDALLVRYGVSLSLVRGLQKLGEVLPLERDKIMSIEGSSSMRSDEVSSFVPLFEQAIGIRPAPMFFQYIQNEIEWLIHNGLHREAFHSLWIGFGLVLKGHMNSGEAERQRKAQFLAQSWLTKAEWCDEGLKSKEKQLGEYVDHIRQIIDNVG